MDLKIDPRMLVGPSNTSSQTTDKQSQDLEKLRETTREFEALYVMEMYKAMRKTVPEGGLFEKDTSTEIYQDMLDMEAARKTAAGKGMGIGEAMFEQMKAYIPVKKAP